MKAIGLILLLALPVQAAVHTAADCTQAEVQTALTAAAADTDASVEVVIPACSGGQSWTSGVTYTAHANTTSLIIRGAGSTSILGGNDQTVIIDNYASGGDVLMNFSVQAAGTVRIYGITIQGGASATGRSWVVQVTGQNKNFRADHMHFDFTTYPATPPVAFVITGHITGVIDNNLLDFPNNGGSVADIRYTAYNGTPTDGDIQWNDDSGFGTSDFVFIEDNTINQDGRFASVQDCYNGGKWVVRYNTIDRAGVQTHPTGGSGRGRGCRGWELYGNNFTSSGVDNQFNVGFISSASGLVWGNTVDENYDNFIRLLAMRRNGNTYPQCKTPEGWGYAGTNVSDNYGVTCMDTGSALGDVSFWDGNTDANGYPNLDQPGRGRGDLLSGTFATLVNVTNGNADYSTQDAWPRQDLEPIYGFSNTVNVAVTPWTAVTPEVIVENRDYYLEDAMFDGTGGVGVGLIANRPATCTTGVAYWATNEGEWNSTNGATADGKMYVCTATNTWTARYGGGADNTSGTPYTYPHPLRNEAGGGGAAGTGAGGLGRTRTRTR